MKELKKIRATWSLLTGEWFIARSLMQDSKNIEETGGYIHYEWDSNL
jgi:hypothetical protein